LYEEDELRRDDEVWWDGEGDKVWWLDGGAEGEDETVEDEKRFCENILDRTVNKPSPGDVVSVWLSEETGTFDDSFGVSDNALSGFSITIPESKFSSATSTWLWVEFSCVLCLTFLKK
jgi:hypothetical protein